VVRSVTEWAAATDIIGVAVVGSRARRQARMDPDLDLVVLTDNTERYLSVHGWRPL
jgi:predicted nucleotidyltransferase